MKELGPRGWEIRAAVIKQIRVREREKYVKMLQRSILLCPELKLESQWRDIRPFVRHTEGYAVLPEQDCKKAFYAVMGKLMEGRPVLRKKTAKTARLANQDVFAVLRRKTPQSNSTPKAQKMGRKSQLPQETSSPETTTPAPSRRNRLTLSQIRYFKHRALLKAESIHRKRIRKFRLT
jgi:hypothetical protein